MKMKLGMKIGSGFGFLIFLAAALGMVAVVNMGNVGNLATQLAKEYLPEVTLSNDIERNSAGAMHEIRGYGFTADESYLKEGLAHVEKMKAALAEAEKLAQQSVHLEKLKGAVDDAKKDLVVFENLIGETRKLNSALNKDREDLGVAARKFMDGCYAYLGDQDSKLKAEIKEGVKGDKLTERYMKTVWINDVIDAGNGINLDVWKAQGQRDPKILDETAKKFATVAEKLNAILAATSQEANIKQINGIKEADEKYKEAMNSLKTHWLALDETNKKLAEVGENTLSDAQGIAQSGMQDTDKVADDSVAALGKASTMMTAGLIAVFIIGVTVAYFLTVSITRPITRGVDLAGEIARGDFSMRLNMDRADEIGQLADALDRMSDGLQASADLSEQIAKGNLDVEVKLASEKDQLGKALHNMVSNLNEVLGQIKVSGDQIASGSGQVSESSQSLSQGATESASSLEEITSSMNEISSQTKQNAENATTANKLAVEARGAADNGNSQMREMVSAMNDINVAGQNISKIIKVIDEIAFQTNLLALNAAVEAARAGRHGKGFAVVAEEVRNLAARSAKAAEETAEMIEGSVKKAENGAQIAERTAKALGGIVAGVSKVTDLVGEIAAASNEQAQGLAQINQGLGQIDQVTQQNTANAEESAAAAEELSSQAEQLRQMLTRFKLSKKTQFVSAAEAAPMAPPMEVVERHAKSGNGHGKHPVKGKPALAHKPILAHAKGGGWGGTATKEEKTAKPEEVIALDDKEFGKY